MSKLKEGNLTPFAINAIKPGGQKKHFDGRGLFIFVTPKGSKIWRYKYRFDGQERTLVIGTYPEISLAEAREKRRDAAKAVKAGRDPQAEKKLAVDELGAKVFETVFRDWLQFHQDERVKLVGRPYVKPYVDDLLACMEMHVFPEIGRLNIDEITSKHVIDLLRKIGLAGRADIVRRRLVFVFQYAAAMQLRPDSNPAEIAAVLIKKPVAQRMPALITIPEVVGLLERVDRTGAYAVHKLLCRFLALTAVRPGMAASIRWDELETDAETGRLVWKIPAAKMKMRKPFVCALSHAAVEILDVMRPLSGHFEYVFPRSTEPRLPVPKTAVHRLLHDIGYAGIHVAHGFRSSFSSIMNKREKADGPAIEAQLAHVTKGVAGFYNREHYLERRIEIVDQWASLITPTLAKAEDVLDGRIKHPIIPRLRRAA
jgi:integrase